LYFPALILDNVTQPSAIKVTGSEKNFMLYEIPEVRPHILIEPFNPNKY
jgi:hypothetical protein